MLLLMSKDFLNYFQRVTNEFQKKLLSSVCVSLRDGRKDLLRTVGANFVLDYFLSSTASLKLNFQKRLNSLYMQWKAQF